jgi:S-methylmethionine-dependent homocysteine/selenocysteine methylase
MPIEQHEWRQRLERPPLILDGATGTELTRRGVDTRLPLWSAAALDGCPEIVAAIHADYVAAGADILVANTFRANARTLRRANVLERGAELNRRAVELARSAAVSGARPLSAAHAAHAEAPVLVAASVAPVEDCYRPDLVPDERTLRAEHGQMTGWLADAKPDLIWIETMNTAREAAAAAWAASQAWLPFCVSFVTRESGALLDGSPLEDAVAAVEPYEPLALGINCVPPAGLADALARLRRSTDRPLAAYAHVGNAEPILGWRFSQTVTPAAYFDYARRWRDLGAAIIGGCCGTTPEHIAALGALRLDERSRRAEGTT